MLDRSADAAAQHAASLVAVVVLAPLLALLGVALFADRSEAVSARLWADPSQFAFASVLGASNLPQTPAQEQVAGLNELVGSDVFVNRVLEAAAPAYGLQGTSAQARERDDFRSRFKASATGDHVYLLTYRARDPRAGAVLLNDVIAAFASTVSELVASQANDSNAYLGPQVAAAQADMTSAGAALSAYQAAHRLDPAAAAQDPTYATLSLAAQAKIDAYLSLVDRQLSAESAAAAAPAVAAVFYRVLDPPAAASGIPPWVLEAGRWAGLAIIAAAAMDLLAVYAIARNDPCVRGLREVRLRLGLLPLAAAPSALRSR